MADNSTLLRAVSALKPSVPPVDEAESRALLDQVNARIAESTATAEDTVHLTPRQPPVAARRVLAGAAAAALLAVGVVTVNNYDNTPAYADWTPVPTELTDIEIDPLAETCPPSMPGPAPGNDVIELDPVLAEQRGQYRMLLSVGEDDALQWCFIQPDGDAPSGMRPGAEGVVWGAETATRPTEPDGLTILVGNRWDRTLGNAPVTLAIGTAGDDVAGVEVHTENDSFAEATVNDGWWIAWFPGDVPLGDTATVTTDDGEEIEVPLEGPGG